MRPLGRPLFDATASRSASLWETYHYLANYGNSVGTSGQLNMSMCGWYYLSPESETATSLDLITFYTYTNETMKISLLGSDGTGVSRMQLAIEVWNMTSGNGQTMFPVQPTFPCWAFVALSAPSSSGTPARGYYSLLNEDRWNTVVTANMTGPATKPDMAIPIYGTWAHMRAVAHYRVFNWSLTIDEWRLEKWRFRPSGREYIYHPFGKQGVIDLIGGKTMYSTAGVTSVINGPITQHEMLARRRRRTPLDYRFAAPAADVSNAGWTRVP